MKSRMEIIENHTKVWRNERGQTHRLDGHAVEYHSGTKFWYIEYKLHRLNGPATIIPASKRTIWNIDLMISYDPIMDNA